MSTCEIPVSLWVLLVAWRTAADMHMEAPDLATQISAACKEMDCKRDLLIAFRAWEARVLADAVEAENGFPLPEDFKRVLSVMPSAYDLHRKSGGAQ